MNDTTSIPGFRNVPRTGVIYVTSKARENGYEVGDPEWANLGQGSPESGDINSHVERIKNVAIDASHYKYSPVAGHDDLRQKVADLYNQIYRKDKASQYTAENVSIAGGGRQALARVVASLGNINMGHFLPDYTAYEELLSSFKGFTPIPILLEKENNYRISTDLLYKEILGRGLSSLLISNPSNPTGQLIEGDELKRWVDIMRECDCSLIIDEFYSHYIYNHSANEPCHMVSAAEFIDDVNKDPVIILDGLTKNWRYPGIRISWVVGPKEIIETINSAGSFLDGGANHPFQISALDIIDIENTIKETTAIQKLFSQKRDYVVERLNNIGIKINAKPNGAFYIWADLSELPEPLNNSNDFFNECLKEKVITVPGIYFDVNPSGRRRKHRRYTDHCRISYGPDMQTLERGLDSIERVIAKYK